jgi:peptidoglycan/LPS O-acetylase OafA/YrhL
MYSAYVFHVLESTDFTRAIVFASLYGLLVLSVTGLEQAHSLPVPRFLRFMGDTSYTVYLSHLLVMSAIGRLWALVGPNPDSYVDNIVVCIIMLAAVVGYGWIGYRVIERPVLQLCRRLPILRPKIESRHAPV